MPALLVGVVLPLLLYLSGLFPIFTPLPVLYQVARRGLNFGVLTGGLALAALLALYLAFFRWGGGTAAEPPAWALTLPGLGFLASFGPRVVQGYATLYFLYYLLIGCGLGVALRRRWSLEKTFLLVGGCALLIPVGMATLWAAYHQVSLWSEARVYLAALVEKILSLNEASGLSGDELLFLKEHQAAIARQLFLLLPAFLIDGTLVVLWVQALFFRRWRLAPFFEAFGDLGGWRLSDRWIWGPIGAGAGYFLNLYFLESPAVEAVALNGLAIFLLLYFFQGLSIVVFYVRKRRSPVLRGALYLALLVFFQMAAPLVAGLGLFDLWLDFRKLRKKEVPCK